MPRQYVPRRSNELLPVPQAEPSPGPPQLARIERSGSDLCVELVARQDLRQEPQVGERPVVVREGPNSHGSVIACREDTPAVGAELRMFYPVPVTERLCDRL